MQGEKASVGQEEPLCVFGDQDGRFGGRVKKDKISWFQVLSTFPEWSLDRQNRDTYRKHGKHTWRLTLLSLRCSRVNTVSRKISASHDAVERES